MLELNQLRANTSKSKFVVIGTPESQTEILKEAEENPIRMGDTIIENSKSVSISVIKSMKGDAPPVYQQP